MSDEKTHPVVAVFCGGTSAERDVSLASGHAVAEALRESFSVRVFELEENGLPDAFDPATMVAFPALHGTFGEDGGVQNLLELSGAAYAGCGVAASELCFDKEACRRAVARMGVRVAPAIAASSQDLPTTAQLLSQLGPDVVIKPVCQGSSVGLRMVSGEAEMATAINELTAGRWLFEQRVIGREMTVGVLDGKALGVVEIIPVNGVFDYKHKYTKGMTEYRYPAKISDMVTFEIQAAAEEAFTVCGCRDFARVDFMLDGERCIFLEVNTLPGLTATSLLPKSASCHGIDFSELVRRMVLPGMARFDALNSRIKT